jgi:ATP-binding cassette subfamily F protein uup
VKALSGGERTRVALAKLLRQETSLLLLDEPTNDLDLDTLAALESLLLEHDVTAIVVTHDRWFLDRIATSILWFQGEQRVVRFVGNYSIVAPQREALERKRAELERAQNRSEAVAAPAAKKKAGLSYKEQKELDQIESLIAAVDARISEFERLLAELDTQRAESERLMNRWAELEEKRGG